MNPLNLLLAPGIFGVFFFLVCALICKIKDWKAKPSKYKQEYCDGQDFMYRRVENE